MLATWSRVIARSTARNALNKPLGPLFKAPVVADQFRPTLQQRALAAAAGKPVPKATAAKKPAAKTTPAKTTAATGTKKTATATKPAPKKATTTTKKTSTTKKTATKKATAKKVPVKKSAKKPKKTPEEQQKEHIKELKGKALNPPTHPGGVNIWAEFLKSKLKGYKVEGGLAKVWNTHGDQWKAEFDSLTDAQKETFKSSRVKQVEDADTIYKNWVLDHTPRQIHEANLARARLRKIRDSTDPTPRGLKTYVLKDIQDDRYPKRPRNALIMYVMDRLKGYQGEPNADKMKYVRDSGKVFNTLSDAEKAKYRELAEQDAKRYYNELRTIGVEPPKPKSAKA